MTASDKPLAKRARAGGDRSGVELSATISARDFRAFLSAFERLGYPPGELLGAAGLNGCALDDPDVRIACEAFGAMMGAALRLRPLPNAGVRLAAETLPGAFPLLDYLILTSSSIGAGMQQLARYFHLVGGPTSVEVREGENPARVMVWAGHPASAEFTVSLLVLNLRRETGGRFQPEFAAFTHQPDDASEVEQILSCQVRTLAAWNGVAISRENWELPLERRDPVLRELLQRQADELVARLPAGGGIVSDVRRVLATRIVGGNTKIESVAEELAVAPRTLQRRLAARDLSYQDLVELTRRDAAERYLVDLSLPIAEVAYLLGYSEPSVFHRAFKRWNGLTPQQFRKVQRPAARPPSAQHGSALQR